MQKEETKLKRFLTKYNNGKDDLQKKYKFLNNSLSLFNDQLKLIDSILKSLNTHKTFLPKEENKQNYIYFIIKLIIENYEIMVTSDRQLIQEIISNLTTLIDNVKEEKKKYENEIESLYNNMKEEKENLEKFKKKFFESINITEVNILNKLDDLFEKKEGENKSFQSYELIKESKNDYMNYMTSIDKLNKIITQFNDKEKSILDGINKLENNFWSVSSIILNHFYENQHLKNNVSSKNKNYIKNEIIINNNNILNKKTKSTDLIVNKYALDEVKFEKFNSKINFFNIENNKEFKKCIYTIDLLNENIGKIYPDFSLDKEITRNHLREKIKNLISNLDYKILDKDKNELFEILKNNLDNQRLFLSELNRIRTVGKYKRNKDIIDLTGTVLNIILDNLAINRNFEMAKNCIILSQTFYYENDKKEKKFIYEQIINNKNVQNEDFWRYFIDLLISKEFMKLQKNLEDKNINIFMKDNIPENMLNKIEELLFAQIVPCINNMIEFNIDKVIIMKILEEFISKYDYLKKEKIECIYNIISNNKEEIEIIKEESKKRKLSQNIKQKNIKEEKVIESENKKEEKNISNSNENNGQNEMLGNHNKDEEINKIIDNGK